MIVQQTHHFSIVDFYPLALKYDVLDIKQLIQKLQPKE